MPRKWVVGVSFLLGILTAIGLWGSPLILETLMQPIEALLGSQKQLNSTLLEVSESALPVREAGRKLLQPLGALRLIRVIPDKEKSSPQK
jgi:hypothetical protein